MKNKINQLHIDNNIEIAIIGLGYVGLPLAVEFVKYYSTIGFDINQNRLNQLQNGIDITKEITTADMNTAITLNLKFTNDYYKLHNINVYIVTVPTPINKNNQPDLTPLLKATKTIAKTLKPGNIIIFESTVYPGATEEECVPILEKFSGLKFNQDFFCGYSPERINPGDKKHTLTSIKKITSGSTPEIAEFVDILYKTIISAGTHKAASIKIAEAAKVIENTQRDLNIALINELTMIFNKLEIDTEAVLEAAGTKWNFLPFRPGLVGGHCIGVDPYYLTHKAQTIGYHPEIILAGRRLNDNMGIYVVSQLLKTMMKRGIQIKDAKILIMGLTFKENCPDLRNTRVVNIISELQEYGINVEVYDPWVDKDEAFREYNINPIIEPTMNTYDGIILAVAHYQFVNMDADFFHDLCKDEHVLYDLKYILGPDEVDIRL